MLKSSDGGYIYSNIGDMASHEFMIYCVVRGIKPKSVLEIGIRAGVSTQAICSALQDEKIECKYHCCDIDATAKAVQRRIEIPLIFHIMTSDKLSLVWNHQIDLLFIDGYHEFGQVKRDYDNFGKFVSKGGFIFFHDTFPPSEKHKQQKYCGDAFKILDILENDNSVETITFPYSYGLTVCRKK